MTLETIYFVSQIVAVIVIIATLVAILWQARQTNTIARAELTLTTWFETGALHQSLVDTQDKAELMYRAMIEPESLTKVDKFRLPFFFGIVIGTHEAAYNLRARGLIEASAYAAVAHTTRRYMKSPVMRKLWSPISGIRGGAGFEKEVNAIVASIEAAEAAERAVKEPAV